MSASFLDRIDWSRPWMAPLLSIARPILQAPDWRDAINEAAREILNHHGLPICFVPQDSLPPDMAYEAYISATGNVPTRDNSHDFFNALMWLGFPKIKAQLNALQANEIARAANASPGDVGAGKSRGKLRDAATIFDENAALLIASDTNLVDALHEHRWRDAFISRREAFGSTVEVWLFGHALIEKLVNPYKAITAHTWDVKADAPFFDMPFEQKRGWIDTMVSGQLRYVVATSDFMPLPVLGIPGWWDGQDDLFYADASVFRPKRQLR